MAFVCVHVCACVYVCKPVCTQTPTRGCGGRRSMPGVLLCVPPLSYTRQGLTEPASTKESACLLLSARITGLAMPICVFILFYVMSGDSNSGLHFCIARTVTH